jgi:hypothetical protein
MVRKKSELSIRTRQRQPFVNYQNSQVLLFQYILVLDGRSLASSTTQISFFILFKFDSLKALRRTTANMHYKYGSTLILKWWWIHRIGQISCYRISRITLVASSYIVYSNGAIGQHER